ncbi:MAG TPA: dual specificity protein phosphatase 23 [Candidatus Brocadiia bacterium]|nr:dual specificity protein phosphatase family protein [Planctomycetota bacterium]MDO8093566.1 dual specificity protein phosphatase 23 [Candidatus Brocadiales bacterium]
MPRNFSWLIPGEIAGMARPASTIHDFESLRDDGIDAIVSLTENPLNKPLIEEFGFEYVHIPIEDLSVPTMDQVEDFVEFATRMRNDGKKIVVHCGAGIGRTGTMLACYLVSKGYSAEESIDEVRRKRPGSIETDEQVEVIHRYERKLADENRNT